MNFRSARFVKSASKSSERPEKGYKEILFVGRSNVGKSSLINALCDNKSLVFTSYKPGHTRLLNYFEIPESCYLVDAPGYGYSSAGKAHALAFGEMMEEYFTHCPSLALVVFLLDSRREPSIDDVDFYEMLLQYHLPFCIVLTKCDKLNQKEKALCKKRMEQAFPAFPYASMMSVSILKKDTMERLKQTIEQHL